VIDDGWAERPSDGVQQNGDWIVNRRAFPQGLRATTDAIRQRGLIPGIWFEFEVINAGARAWNETTHQLHRDGVPLQIGNRRFWDFRDPWVHAYLEERVIGLLRENDFGYLKVDYNDTLGIGCDGAESLGEGLRQHLEGVQRFFRRLREVLPDLVIENCASGGHRAEPSMMALTAMTSFSDAHETSDVPVIAANLNRLILARQSQIWAVLRKDDPLQRISYSLAATFLGRMCLSGDVHALAPEAWRLVLAGVALYQELAPVIAHARFHRYGKFGPSYQHLTGWQAVVVESMNDERAFVVWHVFAAPPEEIRIPLPAGRDGRFREALCDAPSRLSFRDRDLLFETPGAWSGGIIVLE
jgi:alpha-galactosidase